MSKYEIPEKVKKKKDLQVYRPTGILHSFYS